MTFNSSWKFTLPATVGLLLSLAQPSTFAYGAPQSCDATLLKTLRELSGDVKELITQKKAAKNYPKLVAQLKAGDLISVNGNRYQLGPYLGGGETTRIFSLGKGKAIRISIFHGQDGHDYREIARSYSRIRRELKQEGVKTPEVYETPDDLVTVVSEERVKFTLEDFLLEDGLVGKEEEKRARQALLEFARSVWKFEYISDFNPSQLIWNGDAWVLVDFGSDSGDFSFIEDFSQKKTLFSPVDGKPSYLDMEDPKLRDKLIQEVQAERKNQKKANPWVRRLQFESGSGYLIDRIIPESLPKDYVLRTHPVASDPKYPLMTFEAPERAQALKIVRPLNSGKRVLAYEVELKNGSLAVLKFLRNDDKESLDKMAKKLVQLKKQNPSIILDSGPDFLLLKHDVDDEIAEN